MTEYTKVNVRKDLIKQLKPKATADNRSLTKYIEQLIIQDITPPQPIK